ncbi:Uncharacterised protein [Mycobacteroides abscessus subsp. abscessus]|nr:Uncharacterised protein [Mycobacteroides abscessus subsp. abscessus]
MIEIGLEAQAVPEGRILPEPRQIGDDDGTLPHRCRDPVEAVVVAAEAVDDEDRSTGPPSGVDPHRGGVTGDIEVEPVGRLHAQLCSRSAA